MTVLSARQFLPSVVVEQVSPAGGTVGDRFGIPHVAACEALALNPDPNVPPGVLPWPYMPGLLGRLRNQAGDSLLRWLARPVLNELSRYRELYRLLRLCGGIIASTGLAQIAQQPEFFDFPRRALPEDFRVKESAPI